jgi:urease accessory protein
MDRWPLTATFIATHCTETQLKAVQDLFEQTSFTKIKIKGHLSVTLKEDLLICRFLGEQAEHARACFIEVWKLIRPAIMNQQAHIPRIWNT